VKTQESGFTLVAFVITLSVMSIMMGVAVQAVSFQMRREREAELIFRGEQYIEAIRLYKVKYGRSPMRMKELWEAKPKVLRRKWKDPMTDSMQWALIFEGDMNAQGGQGMPGAGGVNSRIGGSGKNPTGGAIGGGPVPTGTPGFGSSGRGSSGRGGAGLFGDDEEGATPGQPAFPISGDGTEGETGNPTRMGPIIGVHSTSCEESIKEYDARSTYCEWRFIYHDRSQGGGAVSPGAGGTQGGRQGYHGGSEPPGQDGRGGGPRPTGTVRP